MVRKFRYFSVFCIVVGVAGVVALRYYARELSEFAFVPRVGFEAQSPLAGNAYDDPAMWFSRPGMGAGDPARWVPAGLTEDADSLNASVFFIHPTSYLARNHWNAALDNADSQTRARLFIRGLASPFNRSVEVWAPRYRQAAFGALISDKLEAHQAIDAAYADVAQAFANGADYIVVGRPIRQAASPRAATEAIQATIAGVFPG